MKKLSTNQLTKVAITASLYFVISMVCKPISFGLLEFRLSEMLNFLMFLDPIYIIGVTLGCAITNLFTFGIIDVFVGAGSTAIVGLLMWKSRKMYMGIVYATIGVSCVALELYVLFGLPFWITYATGAIGEFVSMVLGYIVARRIFKSRKIVEMLKSSEGNNKQILNMK